MYISMLFMIISLLWVITRKAWPAHFDAINSISAHADDLTTRLEGMHISTLLMVVQLRWLISGQACAEQISALFTVILFLWPIPGQAGEAHFDMFDSNSVPVANQSEIRLFITFRPRFPKSTKRLPGGPI